MKRLSVFIGFLKVSNNQFKPIWSPFGSALLSKSLLVPITQFVKFFYANVQPAWAGGAVCRTAHRAFAEAFHAAEALGNWSGFANRAQIAHDLGLRVNAGHGLNYQNLPLLLPSAAPGGVKHRP